MQFNNIKRGEIGERVTVVQSALRKLQVWNGQIDGKFGPATEKGVMLWEASLKRNPEGIVDETEYLYLKSILEGKPLPLLQSRVIDETSDTIAGLPKIPHGQAGLIELFGEPWKDELAWWKSWGCKVKVPEVFSFNKSDSIYVNKYIASVVEKTFLEIAGAGLAAEVKTFDGSFSVRTIRGYENSNPPKYSVHTWAMAIDINAAENPLGAVPCLSKELVKCFDRNGWIWGGRFKRLDGMHFQYATGI